MFHQTIIHGRIGKPVEVTYTNSGTAVAKFSVAVSEKYNGEEKTTWYNVVAFKATAENLAKFFDKGSEIILFGSMSFGSYEKDSQTHRTAELVVSKFDFCGSKQQSQQPQNNGYQQQGGYQPTQPPAHFYAQGQQEEPPF